MDPRLERLRRGQGPLYVATFLFEHTGRYYGSRLEHACLQGLREGLETLGLPPEGPLTFLPYRDSNGAVVPRPGESLTQAIYRLDTARVRNSFALLAPLYHTQYDGGVSFEIGYAAGIGLPVLVLLSNFFCYKHDRIAEPQRLQPLLELLADEVLCEGDFPLSGLDPDPRAYRELIEAAFERIERRVREAVRALVLHYPGQRKAPDPPLRSGQVFLEFGGGEYEYQMVLAERAAGELEALGWRVGIAQRYQAASAEGLREGAERDFWNALTSEAVVIFGDGADVNPESAALQGYLRALGRRVLLYCSSLTRLYVSPEYDTRRNLMLMHSADRIVTRLADLAEAVGFPRS
ncbi:nucleoside 2-deoxyribosyltransferase [Calidithermus timidus]|uniref:nucleoside 2-deoxyribosyltransferase n=1 Tax=Calidithermus timidus TaxID=307124 RepID=UPI00036199F2|nr:nucleoside 2-deoxyribosyltransferase [Calidithermus timidus]